MSELLEFPLIVKRVAVPGHLTGKTHVLLDTLEERIFAGSAPRYDKAGSYWWIAYCGDKPVGFAGATFYDYVNSFFLCRAGVDKKYRGHGLQRRFLRCREAEARRQGIPRCNTYVSYDNVHSANNLIRCGYTIYIPPAAYAGWSGMANSIYFERVLTHS